MFTIFLVICFLKHSQYLAGPQVDFLKVSQRRKPIAFPCSLLGLGEAQPPPAFLSIAVLAPGPWHRPCSTAAQTTLHPDFAKSTLHHFPRWPLLPARSEQDLGHCHAPRHGAGGCLLPTETLGCTPLSA